MEQAIISGVAHDISEAKVTVHSVPDQPGVAADLFESLAGEGVNVDMIVQNVSSSGQTDISFTVPKAQSREALDTAEAVAHTLGAGGVDVKMEIAKVSLVGAGMKTESGIAGRVFRALAVEGINIHMISTSTIRISCVIDQSDVSNAVQALASAFELENVAEEVGA